MSDTLYKYYTTIKNCKTLEILEEVFKTIKENVDMLKIDFNILEGIYKNEVNELISQDKKTDLQNTNLTLKELHEKLKKEYPILAEYESKLDARGKVTGYMAEKIDKELLVLAKTIKSDKNLSTYLKKNLPGISNRMDSRITQSLNRGIDFDLER